jgi:hypothetical protein
MPVWLKQEKYRHPASLRKFGFVRASVIRVSEMLRDGCTPGLDLCKPSTLASNVQFGGSRPIRNKLLRCSKSSAVLKFSKDGS